MIEPKHNCTLCPRLVDYREKNKQRYPSWHNGPVQSFGPLNAKLLIVGLAPGLKGANQTGRPFTGDVAGYLLYATLKKFHLAKGEFEARPDDSLELINTRITNSVRCWPPDNKPLQSEIDTCQVFLKNNLRAMSNLKIILALGRIAHDSLVKIFNLDRKKYIFKHNHYDTFDFDDKSYILMNSYHCSKYNTSTKRLTPEMFEDVFKNIEKLS